MSGFINKKKGIVALLTVVTVTVVTFFACSGDKHPPKIDEPLAEETDTLKENFILLYDKLLLALDEEFPGKGNIDYGGGVIGDIPKSYAMVLSAEIMRSKFYNDTVLSTRGVNAANWLLANADIDGDGIFGWGVPVAWDAFGDDSENPENTEYTITNGIVINALLDWISFSKNAPKEQIKKIILKVTEPYLNSDSLISPSGLMSYSYQVSDAKYDCFNPSAYMAGQLCRFTYFFPEEKSKLKNLIDKTFKALLAHKKEENENWYWNYSVQEEVSNDLPHASYIIDGISQYKKYNGKWANQFDLDKVKNHLLSFQKNDTIYGHYNRVDYYPRSYGLGIALKVAVDLQLPQSYIQVVLNNITDYIIDSTVFKTRDKQVIINEYQAYVVYGLASYLFTEKTVDYLDLYHGDKNSSLVELPNEIEIPLLAKKDYRTYLNTSTQKTTLLFNDSIPLLLNRFAAPLYFIKDKNVYQGIVREIYTNKLFVQFYDDSLKIITERELINRSNEWDFRAVKKKGEDYYVVLYSSVAGKNFFLQFNQHDNLKQIELPTIQDPAGGTYEMTPQFYMELMEDKIMLACGRLLLFTDFNLNKVETVALPKEIEAIIETKVTKDNEVGVLVRYPFESDKNYGVYRIKNKEVTKIKDYTGLVFDLQSDLTVNTVTSAKDLETLFWFDLERVRASGMYYLGINNYEARIPWDQIYYLNGWLDFIALCSKDEGFEQLFDEKRESVKERVALEGKLMFDLLERPEYFYTKAFTVDRSKTLFAVQTSRILMFLDRLEKELGFLPVNAKTKKDFRAKVFGFIAHIDQPIKGFEKTKWISKDQYALHWKKGCKFYYDGTSVPFNHQNEWACAVFKVGDRNEKAKTIATDIMHHFFNHILEDGSLPVAGEWNYWWGVAQDGWTEEDGVSVNTPSYSGDKGKAWISFKTIDCVSTLSAEKMFPYIVDAAYKNRVAELIYSGKIYPFTAAEFLKENRVPVVNDTVINYYGRLNGSWEMRNFVWALYYYYKLN